MSSAVKEQGVSYKYSANEQYQKMYTIKYKYIKKISVFLSSLNMNAGVSLADTKDKLNSLIMVRDHGSGCA